MDEMVKTLDGCQRRGGLKRRSAGLLSSDSLSLSRSSLIHTFFFLDDRSVRASFRSPRLIQRYTYHLPPITGAR